MAMQQAKSLNPALREIESIFNPVDDPIVNQESEENDLEQLREGIFIQRNYNIVPHYSVLTAKITNHQLRPEDQEPASPQEEGTNR